MKDLIQKAKVEQKS